MTQTEQIAKNIKRLRESCLLSQEEAANRLEVTQKAVSAWETGKAVPRMGAVEKMCQLFHCTITDIIGESKQSTNLPSTEEIDKPFEDNDEFMLKHLFKKLTIEQQHQIILEMLEMVSRK